MSKNNHVCNSLDLVFLRHEENLSHYRCGVCASQFAVEESWQCLDPNCPDAVDMPYHDHQGPQRLKESL